MDYLAPPKPNNLWGRSLQGADIVDAVLSPCLYSIICATVSLALSRPFLCPAGAMALSSSIRISLIVAFFGLLAFILGVIAENKKVRPFPCCERWSLTFFPSRGWWILHNTKHYCYYVFLLTGLQIYPVFVVACCWDSYPRKGCYHLQVSKWSDSCDGKPVHCGARGSCRYWACCYLFPVLGQVGSSWSTLSKHQLDCVLRCCWVSSLSAIYG